MIKKYKFMILSMLLVIITILISYTYSRYISSTTTNNIVSVAKWNVVLNNHNMNATTELTVTANDVVNENVMSGKIAPGKSVTFNFDLNPTGSEVAIDYLFEFGSINGLERTSSNIAISSITYRIGENGEFLNLPIIDGNYMVTETLSDVENGKIVHVIVTVTWNNESDTNNYSDTINGISGNNLTMSIPITAKQHIST